MKPGRVVIMLAGRHAGKKAIIVRQHDDGKKVGLDWADWCRTRSLLTLSWQASSATPTR